MKILALSISVLLVAGAALAGAYQAHMQVLNTDRRITVYEIYVDCINQNEKSNCGFLAKRMGKTDGI